MCVVAFSSNWTEIWITQNLGKKCSTNEKDNLELLSFTNTSLLHGSYRHLTSKALATQANDTKKFCLFFWLNLISAFL